AAIAALVFVGFQYLYLETQVFVARLNTVYGVLAAIPLFLIWLNFSWQIIIYGAELTYSFQNLKNYGLREEGRI
ncbi:MAG: YihY/virulence factor BrkB family protein, partial [Bacteroidales bacterium]|nr:YihY/virulence factor BrkB family protein [Bacteroidales bacterium]